MVQAAGVWAEGSNRDFRFVLAANEGFRAQNNSGINGIWKRREPSDGGRSGWRHNQI